MVRHRAHNKEQVLYRVIAVYGPKVSRLISMIVLGLLVQGCQRGKEQAVIIVPSAMQPSPRSVPADPFGTANPAYSKLREVTDAALANRWSGSLDDFAPWLEAQTAAVERALGLLKVLRVGSRDVYAVANGRIAMVYEHIAMAMTRASKAAEAAGSSPDWKNEQARVWDQAHAFWARCARDCSAEGAHLDAWDLRCRAGRADSAAQMGASGSPQSPRQPK